MFRQSNDEFIACLNEARIGECSATSLSVLRSAVDRTFDTSDGISATELYTHRIDVDNVNRKMLDNLPGKGVTFTAKDSGQVFHQAQVREREKKD